MSRRRDAAPEIFIGAKNLDLPTALHLGGRCVFYGGARKIDERDDTGVRLRQLTQQFCIEKGGRMQQAVHVGQAVENQPSQAAADAIADHQGSDDDRCGCGDAQAHRQVGANKITERAYGDGR